jgi:hypothetical protein
MITVQAVSIAVLVVATVVLSVQVARITVSSSTDRRAANQARVLDCFNQQAALPSTRDILLALEDIVQNAVTSTQQILNASPGDPANAARRASIRKYIEGKAKLAEFLKSVESKTPTKRDCEDLANRFGIPTPA